MSFNQSCQGMVLTESKHKRHMGKDAPNRWDKHGIIRQVWPKGAIDEGTWRHGKQHGLNIVVFRNKYLITLWRMGHPVAGIRMNDQLKETARWGEEMHLLDDIPADFFKKGELQMTKHGLVDVGGADDLDSFVTKNEVDEMNDNMDKFEINATFKML